MLTLAQDVQHGLKEAYSFLGEPMITKSEPPLLLIIKEAIMDSLTDEGLQSTGVIAALESNNINTIIDIYTSKSAKGVHTVLFDKSVKATLLLAIAESEDSSMKELAMKEYAKVSRAPKKDILLELLKGSSLDILNNREEAIVYARMLLNSKEVTDELRVRIYGILGQAYLNGDQYLKTIQTCLESGESYSDNQISLLLGRSLFHVNLYNNAISALESVTADDERTKFFKDFYTGTAYYRIKQYNEAIDNLSLAVQLCPESEKWYLVSMMAVSFLRIGDKESAYELLSKVLTDKNLPKKYRMPMNKLITESLSEDTDPLEGVFDSIL